jgi:hypothetical protein
MKYIPLIFFAVICCCNYSCKKKDTLSPDFREQYIGTFQMHTTVNRSEHGTPVYHWDTFMVSTMSYDRLDFIEI